MVLKTERVPESDDHTLQHFLSSLPWDERPVIDLVSKDAGAKVSWSSSSIVSLAKLITDGTAPKNAGLH